MKLSSQGVLTLSGASGALVIPNSLFIGCASDTQQIQLTDGQVVIQPDGAPDASTSNTNGALRVVGGLHLTKKLVCTSSINTKGGDLFVRDSNATQMIKLGDDGTIFAGIADITHTINGAIDLGQNLNVGGGLITESFFIQKFASGGAKVTGSPLGNEVVYECDETGVDVFLPNASGIAGRTYTVKATHGSHNVTVKSNGGAIDASAAGTGKTLGSQYAFITVVSNGTQWLIIGQGGTIS